ncbi:MAG: cytochrome C oxidase subunit IV family protein [Bacteroidetes bacterium]|nr:cytochrome C oxidase subunit IV family protein [Bacteroidota bacterium]MBS1929947.1 cytochrome C oxidase subunit IV family protein [Bacteroidota bacterium]
MSAEQQNVSAEVSFPHEPPTDNVKRIWKTFWILLIITIIELGLGLLIHALDLPDDLTRLLLKGTIIILSLAKAYFIVSIFMHLGDEIRNLILTIVIPLMLFIWFIIAFILDGDSYKHLRNKYDKHFLERTTELPVKKAEQAK